MTPLRLSRQARSDANEAATWYATQGGLALELVFAYALRAVYELIQQHPRQVRVAERETESTP